jgi:hypothetical protein
MKGRRFRTNLRILLRRPRVFLRAYRWPLIFLLLAAAADAASTIPDIGTFGYGIETHLAMRFMMRTFGPLWGCILGKAVQVAIAVTVASLWRTWCPWLLWLCGLTYFLAAVSNTFRLL